MTQGHTKMGVDTVRFWGEFGTNQTAEICINDRHHKKTGFSPSQMYIFANKIDMYF